jgi:hypothetical protein
MVETDPVDAVSAAAGIAIAKLDSPMRRPARGNEAERLGHCAPLLRDATRLPLACDADVEDDGIVDDSPPLGGRRKGNCRKRGRRQKSLHLPAKRYSGRDVPQMIGS